MRPLAFALAAFALTALPVSAQHSRGSQRTAPPPPPPMVVAPPILYPLPPLMPPVAGGLTPPVMGGLTTPPVSPNTPFRTRGQRPGQYSSGAPFVFGYAAPEESVARKPAAPATGLLRLFVTPASAQVFVDSYYVGTVEDIDAQRVLQLEAGPHRIEFRAPQYQTLTVDVRILPYETVTYRGALDLARPAVPAAPAVAGPPTLLYVIPKCYLGNVPPRPGRLPAGCDISKVEILERR